MKQAYFSCCLALALVVCIYPLQAANSDSIVHRLVSTDNRTRESAQAELAAYSSSQQQQVVTNLIPLLKGSDTDQREHAAEALQKLGPAAQAAIPALRQNLSDDFPYVRIHAAEALANIGPAAIPAFIEALKNDNNEVRAVAVAALAHLGPAAASAIPMLIHTLQDSDPTIRRGAAGALENCGSEAVPTLMHSLADSSFTNHLPLIRILGSIDHTPANLPALLVPFLSDPNPDVRLATLKALAHKGKTAVPEVTAALSSGNAAARWEAADILGDIGPDAGSAVPSLINALKDTEPRVRANAAQAIGKMGSENAKSAISALRDTTKDSNRDVAVRAQEALTNITVTFGSEAGNALPVPKPAKSPAALSVPLPVKSPVIAPSHAASIKKPKPAAKKQEAKRMPAAPQATLYPSFLKLDSTASIHALEMTIKKGETSARLSALAALATLGSSAAPAVPVVGDLLKNPSEDVRSAAAGTLEKIGTDDAKKILIAYKKHSKLTKINELVSEMRTSTGPVDGIVAALSAIGPSAVPAAAQALKDPKPSVRLAAAQVLNHLGSASASAASSLIDALNDHEAAVRREAAQALEKMNSPQAKNPLRWYAFKEKIRPLLEKLGFHQL